MSQQRLVRALSALVLVVSVAMPLALADVTPNPTMLRDPDVSATHVVFVYAGDVWAVARSGGLATPLASPRGAEATPRFSPDGKTIAFVGNYDGDRDLYTLDLEGGVPFRVTYHPANETLADWASDGSLVYYAFGQQTGQSHTELFTVSPEGGLPVKLPVPYGAKASIDDRGEWLAYTPWTRDQRTWKRYRGGLATDIWLFNLKTNESRKITDWEGTDTEPMWRGGKLYYLSDREEPYRRNVWSYDPASGEHTQLTRFKDYDIRYAAMGPGAKGQGEIVLQNGASLYLLDLATAELSEVKVRIPGARPTLRPQAVDASDFFESYAISPTGKRVAAGARGDVWTMPAKKGAPRNLTRTSGAAERYPSWSPDGKWIAYAGDASGEYEVYVTQADGMGETRQLTSRRKTFYESVGWSPDSEKVTYQDRAGNLWVYDLEDEKETFVIKDDYANTPDLAWSHDSRFLAFSTVKGEGFNSGIFVYNVEEGGEPRRITSNYFSASAPTFDRKGEYIVYASTQHESPIYDAVFGTTWVYANREVLVATPLKKDGKSPFLPESDDEEIKKDDEDEKGEDEDKDKKKGKKDGKGDDDEKDEKGDKKDKKDDEDKKVEIAFDGLEARAFRIPVDPGSFSNRAFHDKGHLLYVRGAPRGSGGDPAIKIFDFEDDDREEKTVASDAWAFDISADGKKLLIPMRGKAHIANAAADGGKKAKPVVTAGMQVTVDPREEWEQVLRDAWRRYRDYFYDPNMHGVDWDEVYERYASLLPDCATRGDVSFLIREMISELNVGHAYYRPGRGEPQPRRNVGLLGADFTLDQGAYRIATIVEGGKYEVSGRGPLSQPGIDVKEGDYLLAVNGVPVDASKAPWAAFLGTAGRATTITVSEEPKMTDKARHVVVEPMGNDYALRYRHWVESRRRHVEEKSGGRIGYVHVPNTGVQGQNELVRQYTAQLHKDALVIDERWNGGGQIPTRFIELMNRPQTNAWALRDSRDWQWPVYAHRGPKAMLINQSAGSGGDAFPHYFRQAGLGKLIGTRTWGGLVGISGLPGLIDGAGVTVPGFAYYDNDGTWGIEGHGVDPDIEVVDDPALMVDGGDPQLDAAIEHLLGELKTKGYVAPKRPAYPDRSGMGIPEADK